MPNQLNFPDPLQTTYTQRPERLAQQDLDLMSVTHKQILFGTDARDVAETWLYNGDGTIAGHVNLFPVDPDISLMTVIDQSGPEELLNVDMVHALQRMDIQPGRYAIVFNFFRDEVGSEAGYKLYISQISKDRTEVALYPVQVTGDVVHDLHEFVLPSVPRLYANGLIDQFFGKAVIAPQAQVASFASFVGELDAVQPGTMARVIYAGRTPSLQQLYDQIIAEAYPIALDNLKADVLNLYVQADELQTYIVQAIQTVIARMKQTGALDPHFDIQ